MANNNKIRYSIMYYFMITNIFFFQLNMLN